jgi:predicted DNA-binding transcriptional regulator AlpA
MKASSKGRRPEQRTPGARRTVDIAPNARAEDLERPRFRTDAASDTDDVTHQGTSDSARARPTWLPSAADAKAILEARERSRSSGHSSDARKTDPLELLRAADVCRLLRISKPTLWRLRQAEQFPTPTEVTDRVIAWRRSEVEEWLTTRRSGKRKKKTAEKSDSDSQLPLI